LSAFFISPSASPAADAMTPETAPRAR
jgi:hypothetical protein